MALAERRKVQLAAVAAAATVCEKLGAFAEIAERANRNGALARSFSLHGRGSLFVLVMLERLGGGCQLPGKDRLWLSRLRP